MKAPLKHVLCVDDEQDILQVARVALETVGGLRVSLCSASQRAVDDARQLRPDLILLDVMMPEMDGPATLKRLRESGGPGASTPVVFMTAKVQPAEVRHYLDLGAIGVVSKPFDPMTLSDQVRAFWNQSHES